MLIFDNILGKTTQAVEYLIIRPIKQMGISQYIYRKGLYNMYIPCKKYIHKKIRRNF